jgi:hypothetical protein
MAVITVQTVARSPERNDRSRRPATNAGTKNAAAGMTTSTTPSRGWPPSVANASRNQVAKATAPAAARLVARREEIANHRQPARTTARYAAAAGGRCAAAAGSRSRTTTVMAIDAATPTMTRRVGAGTGSRGGPERATARTTIAPTSAVKVAANTVSPGATAPTAGPTAAIAATTTPLTATVSQPPAGGQSVARALLSANCHRADRPRTAASSPIIARPHSRRRWGSAATAPASNRRGRSSVDAGRIRQAATANELICHSATASSSGTTSCATAFTGVGRSSTVARTTT